MWKPSRRREAEEGGKRKGLPDTGESGGEYNGVEGEQWEGE